MLLLFGVFAAFTIFVIVHNHKHEENKIARWACYIGALGVLYIFITYYFLSIVKTEDKQNVGAFNDTNIFLCELYHRVREL